MKSDEPVMLYVKPLASGGSIQSTDGASSKTKRGSPVVDPTTGGPNTANFTPGMPGISVSTVATVDQVPRIGAQTPSLGTPKISGVAKPPPRAG